MATKAAAPLPTGGPTAGGDEFDDIFDYDIGGVNDPFSENYVIPGSKDTAKPATSRTEGAGLGIDEEIEVTRKPRAPRVKLDEHRLLSANGIPKLRKKAKSELKLKGKGHEYSDAARMLAFYQLWLDDLFPKARFLDALAMVEKAGHKKLLQVARMDWINESKPGASEDEVSSTTLPETNARADAQASSNRIAPIFENRTTERTKTPVPRDGDMDMDDLYDATPKATRPDTHAGLPGSQDSIFGGNNQSIFGPRTTAPASNQLDEDDLDALLAEEDALQTSGVGKQATVVPKPTETSQDNFEDEMEAMADMDGMW